MPDSRSPMFLRKCTTDQAEEMSDYLHPIWHEVYDDIELGGPEGVEYIFTKWVNPGSIRKSISEGYEFGYLEHEGERVGLYSFRFQEDGSFHISKLYLERCFRGRGLGQMAISELESVARSRKCLQMHLSVFFYNKQAIRAYERAGFELHYRRLQYIGNGIVQNDYIMRKTL